MLDENIFEAYNHYLFQMGNQKEFNQYIYLVSSFLNLVNIKNYIATRFLKPCSN